MTSETSIVINLYPQIIHLYRKSLDSNYSIRKKMEKERQEVGISGKSVQTEYNVTDKDKMTE
jgi:hypothetical protein